MCTLGFHLFSLYTWELNFGQTIWDKTQELLGTSWGMHLGTFWEQGKNTKESLFFPSPPLKRKKIGLFMSAC
jgi:hypothetical protein